MSERIRPDDPVRYDRHPGSCVRCGHGSEQHEEHPLSTAENARRPCRAPGCICYGYERRD